MIRTFSRRCASGPCTMDSGSNGRPGLLEPTLRECVLCTPPGPQLWETFLLVLVPVTSRVTIYLRDDYHHVGSRCSHTPSAVCSFFQARFYSNVVLHITVSGTLPKSSFHEPVKARSTTISMSCRHSRERLLFSLTN